MAFDLQHMMRHLEQGRSKDAASALEEHLAQYPHHAAARVLLARAYAAEERWAEAQQQWQQARLLAPGSPAVREGLSQARTGRTEAAASSADDTAARKRGSGALAAPVRSSEILREIEERSDAPGEAGGRDQGDGVDVSTIDNLDRLIEELDAARIAPDPEIDDIPAPDLDDDLEDVVSETLARIYAAQNQYGEAARVYERLAEQKPDRADEFRDRAAEMRAHAAEAEGK